MTLPSERAHPAPGAGETPAPQPWWRHGHVWLVIGGPAVVVLASIATLVLALRQPDPVLAEDAYRKGVQVDRAAHPEAQGEGARALMPALQGRNHAVSPTPPTAASGPR